MHLRTETPVHRHHEGYSGISQPLTGTIFFFVSYSLFNLCRVHTDKFRYIRGQRGTPEPRGKDAVELHKWCPDAVLRMFRESEQCTYFFNTEGDGILNNKGQMALKDRFGKNNAICLQNFHKPMKIGKYYSIPLKDSLYKISGCRTATVPSSILKSAT